MTDTPMPLAADFPTASREEWLKLVDKALKGGDFERRMVSRTADSLRIEPLYTRADAPKAGGVTPFVRGIGAETEGMGWSIEQVVVAGTPDAANAAALAELEGGANGLVLRIAAPGQSGIAIASGADMARVLAGIYLDYVSIVLDAGADAERAAGFFREAIAALGKPADRVSVRFDIDPIGVAARTGHSRLPLDAAIKAAAASAKVLKDEFALARTVLVDGRIAHEAGASEAQELAVIAASLVAYLRAFDAAGVDVTAALAQITVAVSVDADQFLGIAKLRALRRIIARIAEASGAGAAVTPPRIAATTSARMMTKRDPWTNMLRTTIATAAAAFGGADAVTVLPYTWALGMPDSFALRIARNTQLVAQEESSLGRVTDPAGGSWYVEKLTDDLAHAAWSLFQSIERQGGIVSVLASGSLVRDITHIVKDRDKAIATGKQPLTGTSAFPLLGDDGVTVAPWPAAAPPVGEALIEPLFAHRLAAPFEDLRDAADAYTAEHGKRPTVFLASLGTIADHTARTTWVKNHLAVAGIDTIVSDGYASPAEATAAFKGSHVTTACICSSDDVYKLHAEATAKALTEAGAARVLMAGRPGDQEPMLRAAGVDGFLYAGQNAVETLTELQHELTA
ncbi:MAG: methylmalonyl-CoA mutase [Hyphomicrobiaceae bacterium]|nr:methylmalonyl-CoA mutase [Hyphomicrobiaceae bacterium]